VDAKKAPAADPPLSATLHGAVDVLNSREAQGWAFDSKTPDAPVRVSLVVDGKELSRVEANYHRADLEPLGYGKGMCGFVIHLNKPLRRKARVEIVAHSRGLSHRMKETVI
jgi:hypothetical protein